LEATLVHIEDRFQRPDAIEDSQLAIGESAFLKLTEAFSAADQRDVAREVSNIVILK